MKLHLPGALRCVLSAAACALASCPQLLLASDYTGGNYTLSGTYTGGITASNNSLLTTVGTTTVSASTEDFVETVRLDTSTLTNAAGSGTTIRSGSDYGDALYMAQASTLTNQGSLELISEGTPRSGTGLTSYSTSGFVNAEGASMRISVTGSGNATAISMNRGSSVSNSGELTLSSTGAHASGILFSYASLTNSATGVITVTAQTTGEKDSGAAQGIIASGVPLVNEGSISISAIGVSASSNTTNEGLRLSNSNYGGSTKPSLYNGKEASLNIITRGASVKGLIIADQASAVNEGSIRIEVEGLEGSIYDTAGVNLTGSFVNRGRMDVSAVVPEAATVDACAFRAYESTISNEKGASLFLAAQGGKSRGVVLNGSSMNQAGLLRVDTVELHTNNPYSYGSRKPSSLCLLDGSSTGALTEGAVLAIQSSAYSFLQLGGVQTEQGSIGSTAEGSMLEFSSSLSLTNGELRLTDRVAVTVDGSLSLTQVKVSGMGRFRAADGDSLRLLADGVSFVMNAGNSSISSLVVSYAAAESLIETQTAPQVLYLESSLLEGMDISGSLSFDLSYWATTIAQGDYDRVAFSLGENVNFEPGSELSATWGGTSYTGVAGADGGVQFIIRETPSVPEPATAGLSLLALAALAVRRRRR